MNLIEILRTRVQVLPVGDHTAGLHAVLQHVEVAAAHLKRGQETQDETAFTDAIYRTNQAFEGSLKEAYRVLAGEAPNKTRPYDIELYFQQNATLRQRVLDQFTTYRTEWRNPSTHDYRLDFDEDEALLAIVSVCAFAIVLIDQIAEKLSFDKAQAAAAAHPASVDQAAPLLSRISQLLQTFAATGATASGTTIDIREVELIGAIAGFLSAAMPETQVSTEAVVDPSARLRADIIVEDHRQRVLVEVKRLRPSGSHVERALQAVTRYLDVSGIKDAVVYFYPGSGDVDMTAEEHKLPSIGGQVIILLPAK